MNIIAPIPTPVVFSTGTVNTESVKRDNTQRETIPALSGTENSAAETGIGSESDKVKKPGQNFQAVTYEKPSAANAQQVAGQGDQTKDNAEDESAGKENAEQRQQDQQAQQEHSEQQQIRELKQRDLEVRAHEQAHAAAGGQYAGAPQFEYEKGPDGRNYAVEGEVSIDVSKELSPEDTIRKAQQVKAAALSPAEPSAQDLRVANEATQMALQARTEIAEEKAEQAELAFKQATAKPEEVEKNNEPNQLSFDLEDIVDEIDITAGTRKLDVDGSTIAAEESAAVSQAAQTRDLEISRRVSVIEGYYHKVGQPHEDNLKLSA
ncbi:putative metalloprotease CJM1_0395 family protein [Paraglaciecola sp. L3A3]|uniref:putative metalloprotease CJM1_0395 family protein n=1 Tax=Paraglaciecola sp. L3A3 TaxID=2686358 RepID=UPI00131BB282|nr:putative metalloprotease CJM1_0395 family protein [Paraglaciecola sp. L3A3]